jgi:hypothetical protein
VPRANVLPWARGAALEAAARVFESWIEARGGSAPAEERDGVETVRSFLLANGMARFLPAWEEDTDKRSQMVRDVAGYRQKAGDGWDYFVTSSAWKEICAGLDPRRTAGVLVAKGFIEKGDGAHLSKVIRVPGHGRLRLYHVLSTFLEGDEDETLAADLAPLLKKRGDSRDTGAESRNQLNLARFAVTTSPNAASPVADQVVTPPKRTGDEKRKGSQFFTGGGTTVTSVTTVLEQGRASKRDVEGPSEWRAILEELKLCETPEWLSNDRWAELLVDADTFVSTWGISAKRLGWTALDLFGVYPIAPAARFDVMGLIPMLTGGEVIALTDTAATIRRPSGAVLTYRRSEQSGAVLLSEVKKTARSDVQYGLGCRNLAGG